MTRNEMIEALENGICNVEFIKVKDGKIRTMNATLMEDFTEDYDGVEQLYDGNITVVDVDKNALRSFRVANVKSFVA